MQVIYNNEILIIIVKIRISIKKVKKRVKGGEG